MTFYLRMAWRSLRRTRGVTAVMILALSLGIGSWYAQRQIFAYLSTKTPYAAPHVFHIALERDAVITTNKRPQIVVPLLRSLLLTRRDAAGVLAGATTRHTMTFGALALLEPAGAAAQTIRVRYTTPDLFAMFDVPIVAGRPWDPGATADVVIEEQLARALFGSAAQALGHTVRVDGDDLRVVGVVGARDRERFHLYERFIPTPVSVYLPIARGQDAEADFPHVVAGGESGIASTWIELPTEQDRARFLTDANAYLARERAAGRVTAPFAVTLRTTGDISRMFAIGGTMNLWPLLTALCLVTCLVNLVRMLMVKFAGRRHDLGLLRAFGVRRRGIIGQLLLEASLIGLVAGLGGLVCGVAMMPLASTTVAATPAGIAGAPTIISLGSALTTIGASIAAAVLAALYPTWVLSRGTPASQLGRS